MGATILQRNLRIQGSSRVRSKTFQLRTTGTATLVLTVRQVTGDKPTWQLGLQKQTTGGWVEARPIYPAGTPIEEGVVYVRLGRRPSSPLRLVAVAAGESTDATLDIFAAGGKSQNPFGACAHPLGKLGSAVVKQIPDLKATLERALVTGLNLAAKEGASEKAAPSAIEICGFWGAHLHGPHDPHGCPDDITICNAVDIHYLVAPLPGPGDVTMPEHVLQYLLANRIDYSDLSDARLQRIASQVQLSADELRANVDNLNVLSEVVTTVVGELKPVS